jgi:hypothetical protein
MGLSGPILRNCYEMGSSVSDTWVEYTQMWNNAYSVYEMFRRNIIRNETDLDQRGWSSYNSAGNNWV